MPNLTKAADGTGNPASYRRCDLTIANPDHEDYATLKARSMPFTSRRTAIRACCNAPTWKSRSASECH
jgi:hypothetical protein